MTGPEHDPGPRDEEPGPPDMHDIAAAEYVLGVLPPAEALALAAGVQHDPELAARIAAWERRLMPLAHLVEPIEPPALLWQRLALATGTAEPEPRRPDVTRRRVRLWRGVALASSAVAASLALFILLRPLPAPGMAVAVLTEFAGPDPVYVVRIGSEGRGLVVTTGMPDVLPGRALELWALRPGATVPQSLGLMPREGRVGLSLALPPGTRLLVSQEPAGGSPTGLPTGPVVLRGSVVGL